MFARRRQAVKKGRYSIRIKDGQVFRHPFYGKVFVQFPDNRFVVTQEIGGGKWYSGNFEWEGCVGPLND